ncbi:XdhC family protein [Telmatospirillum siberiense]|uniref:Xanthine dehydrogenase n=1 Tax=Telmatospirillum siberiense TaxID=382514 RepID=A0A2N3PWY2_9PROT|nr:XdhC/CoxI family protein [Telmatospirillum siberiense]PKU24910.1 xanthine dehydrogenase [Telmatospirillum siberiense]
MDIYEELVRLRREGRRGALATIITTTGSIPSYSSAKMLVRDDGSVVGTIGGGCVEAEVITGARKVMEQEKPETFEFNLNKNPSFDTGLVCGGSLEVFVEPILGDPTLYIFGAGHVGLNVYKVAQMAGFQVVVIDDRVSFANRERFPEAQEVYADDWDKVMASLNPPDTSFILVVTRGHREDMHVLQWAVDTKARYIGMIGSKRKVITVCKELQKLGVPASKFDRVHAPVGFDIGATTPEEISVAVAAEMIAVRRHSQSALPYMRRLQLVSDEVQEKSAS